MPPLPVPRVVHPTHFYPPEVVDDDKWTRGTPECGRVSLLICLSLLSPSTYHRSQCFFCRPLLP